MAQLLREFIGLNYDKQQVKDAGAKGSPIMLRGIMQRADAVNQNGRRYPRHILQREVTNYEKAVREGRALGECDHPDDSVVKLQNASHIVREIGWDGDDVVGTVELLNTPNGKILQSLLESGVKLGISSRGVGDVSTNELGEAVVDENFMLLAFDMVSEPSTQGAWMNEGKSVNLRDVVNHLSKRDRVNRLVNEILKRG